MDTASFPPNSLYVRLHGSAPDHANPIPIPRELAATWTPGAGTEERHDPRAKYGAAVVVLLAAVAAATFVLS